MWHSDAGGAVVMVWLLVTGCSVRGLEWAMMAKGRLVILFFSGWLRYA